VRGDGNCFFRAFLFGWFHALLTKNDPQLIKEANDFFAASYENILTLHATYTVEDFYDSTVNALLLIIQGVQTEAGLVQSFCDHEANYMIVYMRFLTSMHLRLHEAEFAPFLEEATPMLKFTQSHVDPLGKDADNIQISALSQCTKVPIRIEYLDQSKTAVCSQHLFGEAGAVPLFTLLYRPGHYDLLY